jgi:hypothetical protein
MCAACSQQLCDRHRGANTFHPMQLLRCGVTAEVKCDEKARPRVYMVRAQARSRKSTKLSVVEKTPTKHAEHTFLSANSAGA